MGYPGRRGGCPALAFGLRRLLSYVSNLGNLNATYGSFATAIVLVFWLWLANIALLFGAELNAEIEREQELAEGVPAAETLRLPEKG